MTDGNPSTPESGTVDYRPAGRYPNPTEARRAGRMWDVPARAVSAVALGVVLALAAAACNNSTDDGNSTDGTGNSTDGTGTTAPGSGAPPDTTAPATTTDRALDSWRCHPDLPDDPCTNTDLTTTAVDWELITTEDPRLPAADPAVDCLVLPPADPPGTVADSSPWLATVAAPLRTHCRVFVPPPLPPEPTGAAGAAAEAAFDTFLDAAGPNRPLFLIGAAEGADTLTSLAQTRIDPDPELRARLLSITLTGGRAVVVPEGQLSGGTFSNLWVCVDRDQVGCVLSWHTYEAGTIPSLDLAAFAGIPDGQRAVCTHPAGLDGSRGQLRSATFAAAPSPAPASGPGPWVPGLPAVETPFVTLPEYFVAECVNFGSGVWYLRVEPGIDPDDQRRPGPLTDPGLDAAHLGTRNLDLALALGDLSFLLERQLAAWAPTGAD